MTPEKIKSILQHEIDSMNPSEHALDPKKNFSRSRKLPFHSLITTILRMEGKSLNNELISMFPHAKDTPSAPAFIQQRNKLKPDTFDSLFRSFVSSTEAATKPKTLHGMRLLAVDGSDLHIPTDTSHKESLVEHQKPYNMLHLNAMYDLLQNTYVDETIQNYHKMNEKTAFIEMVDRSPIKKALVMADRNYESYNDFAHVIEKGWFFLIRVKDIDSHGIAKGLKLPETASFDESIDLQLTRRRTKAVRELFSDKNNYKFLSPTAPFDYLRLHNQKEDDVESYPLSFRIVRFPITDDTYETVITNLDRKQFPPDELKKLYALRWGIETSFRSLKYTVGLLYFHSKKAEHIRHEIVARLIMYNFFELIASYVIIQTKDRKYTYKVNFSVAVHICRLFIRGEISPPDVEAQIARNTIPIRPDRKAIRERRRKPAISFIYRIS